MKKTVLKFALIALALTAAAQSIRQAFAQEATQSAYGDLSVDQRIQAILQKKMDLESRGATLSRGDGVQLVRDMNAVARSVRGSNISARTGEQPGI